MNEQQKQKHYPAEFRESAVKLAVESDQPISKIADELGVNKNTLPQVQGDDILQP